MFKTNLGTGYQQAGSFAMEQLFQKQRREAKPTREAHKKRLRNDDPTSDGYLGPWGGYEEDEKKKEKLALEALSAEQAATHQQSIPEASNSSVVEVSEPTETEASTVTFHGDSNASDYQGRSWITPHIVVSGGKSVLPSPSSRLPQKLIHTWKGHANGVQTVKFFPKSAQLFLSASLDSTVKLWNYSGSRECVATFTGHSQGVRDVQFRGEGRHFFSASFDTMVHYWDVETGKILCSFSNQSIPFSIAVHPVDTDVFIVGCKNRKAVQYDLRVSSKKPVQEYNEHLGSVSCVLFTENGQRLVTTSDDRKLFVWNYGLPVVDKYISDPHMHSIPALCLDPTGKHLVGQSMDNRLVVYEAFGMYRYLAKKQFAGHSNAGYAIQPGFSNDGKFVVSGSSDGSVFFWDWKTNKQYRSFKAHDGVCMTALWHPLQSSRVVTAGWDGKIKLWE